MTKGTSVPIASAACRNTTIWSSVLSEDGGAIITPAAPASRAARASVRMAAKPGAETPTITGIFARRMTWEATASASS